MSNTMPVYCIDPVRLQLARNSGLHVWPYFTSVWFSVSSLQGCHKINCHKTQPDLVCEITLINFVGKASYLLENSNTITCQSGNPCLMDGEIWNCSRKSRKQLSPFPNKMLLT